MGDSLKSERIKKFLKEGLILILGSAIYAIAVQVLLSPLKISPGGITGIAAALNYVTGFPTGVYILALNIPLIIISIMKFGKMFIAKTTIAIILSSLFIEIINNFYKSVFTDKMLCAVFGGVLLGLGLGLVMLIGASTGGIDIAVKLLNAKFGISIGRAFLIIDGTTIFLSSLLYGDIESMLYSIITIFVSSKTVDLVLGGNADSKALFIISKNEESIKSALIQVADRGVTILPAFGGYTGRKSNILLCVARNHELGAVRSLIIKTDPTAFFFVVSTGDVVGKGFK